MALLFPLLAVNRSNMCFLSNGKLSSPTNLQLWGDSKDKKKRRYLTMVSTKTQYAGVQTHQTIIHLLKHISQKYFEELELVDETGYLETGDEDLLKERFEQMNQLLDQVAYGLDNFPKRDEESFESYFSRLLNYSAEDKQYHQYEHNDTTMYKIQV